MNIFEVHGNWNRTRGNLKENLAQFTGNDRQFMERKEVKLFGCIPDRTGQARHEVTSIIGEFCAPDLSGERFNEGNEDNETGMPHPQRPGSRCH